jgi:hypothetical protein
MGRRQPQVVCGWAWRVRVYVSVIVVVVVQGLYPSKDWCKTTFESKLVRSDTQRSIASSGYFTKHQYFEKLGSWELVDELVKRKEESGAFVPHPDLPDIAAARLYLGFDSAAYQHIGDTTNSNTLTSKADIGNPDTAHDIAMSMMKAKALPVQLNLQDPSALKALHTTAPKFKTPGSNGKPKAGPAGKAATAAKPKSGAMQHITSALKWQRKLMDALVNCQSMLSKCNTEVWLSGFLSSFESHHGNLQAQLSMLTTLLAKVNLQPELAITAVLYVCVCLCLCVCECMWRCGVYMHATGCV